MTEKADRTAEVMVEWRRGRWWTGGEVGGIRKRMGVDGER